jgi:hypothetical protein
MALGDRMHPALERELRALARATDLSYADLVRHLWVAAGWIGASVPSYSTVRNVAIRERRRLALRTRAMVAAAVVGGAAATFVLGVARARLRIDHHEHPRPQAWWLSRSAFP